MDLNALNAALAGLGPWGVLIGVALTFGAQWLRARMKQPSGPVSPNASAPVRPSSPPAPEVPVGPSVTEPKQPLLDALNALLTTGGGVAPEHRGPLLELLVRAVQSSRSK
jgi:hypothetical protein